MLTTTISNEILDLQSASRIILAYGGLILVGIGTIGNILNILIFTDIKALRKMPNSCQIRWLFGRISSNTTMASICLSSIDRYLSTSRNAHYRQLITIRRAILMVFIIVFIYAIPFIPDAFYYTGPNCTAPTEPYDYRQFITYFNTIVTSLLPFLILVIFSILTWHNLQSVQLVQRTRFEAQVNRMMFGEVGMVCFTSFPNIISNIYSLSMQGVKKSALRTAQDNLWSNVFNTINILTYALSFYLFFIISSSFRQNVRTVLCCKKQARVGISEHGLTTLTLNQTFTKASRH
ncbi:hypothetical protein I4U23_003624 [Adineta vaga]|nr:hypothetical protein I4U23_003624 [Adineta vaga]